MLSRTQSTSRITSFLATLFAFVAIPAVALGQEPPAPECTLSFEPASVSAGAPAQEIQATASTEVGMIDAVQVQDGSGLQVSLASPSSLTLTVDATAANPGDWRVAVLSGEDEVCSGSLRVDAGEQP